MLRTYCVSCLFRLWRSAYQIIAALIRLVFIVQRGQRERLSLYPSVISGLLFSGLGRARIRRRTNRSLKAWAIRALYPISLLGIWGYGIKPVRPAPRCLPIGSALPGYRWVGPLSQTYPTPQPLSTDLRWAEYCLSSRSVRRKQNRLSPKLTPHPLSTGLASSGTCPVIAQGQIPV